MANKSEAVKQPMMEPGRPGDKLRRAREAQGLSLQDVATRTRVAMRQLELLERNEFAALPGLPYAVGFARAYARAVGLDGEALANDVRAELMGTDMLANRYEMFEPTDPARVPPRVLAWTAAALAVLLAVGYGVWRTQMFTPPTDQQLAEERTAATAPPSATSAPTRAASPAPTDGPVVLTATGDVWLRIYDQTGERLLEKQLVKGERYQVPATANNPMILTGRPDLLAVTVGGRAIPPLGTAERTIADVPITAAALLSRPAPTAPAATPGAAGSPASAASATEGAAQ